MAEASASHEVEIISRELRHATNDHSLIYLLSAVDLESCGERIFLDDIETECQLSPSTWHCEVLFPKVEDDGKAMIPIALGRTDSGDNKLKMSIVMYVCDRDFKRRLAIHDLPILKENISGGEVVEDGIIAHIPPDLIDVYNRTLRIRLCIRIFSCHP